MRTRLYNDGKVDYQVLRDNNAWPDHQLRTLVTAGLIAWKKPESIIDPACGDGSIVLESMKLHRPNKVVLSDISSKSIASIAEKKKPSKNTVIKVQDIVDALTGPESFDLVVLSETLEHLGNPDTILSMARDKGTMLIASSPQMRKAQVDSNKEHLWMFDAEGYRGMLMKAGWDPINKTTLEFKSEYDFQIWVCT